QRDQANRAALNMVATLLLGIAMAALGWWLAQG
ncbi:MAG TPA: camphor resistance protein CrcB, partial [Halomonas sp.]|nr:camphor resistance protein CrcB [Halomonas sp.]